MSNDDFLPFDLLPFIWFRPKAVPGLSWFSFGSDRGLGCVSSVAS
jgi:hypothetical protein